MRDTATRQPPICPTFLKGLKPLSTEDVANDPEWRFAPVGVVSRHERDVVNAAQLERFARAFGLPLFRWKLPLLDELPNVDRNDLYNAEPSLWGYFVEGAPINLTENIKPVRKLVNGSPGILDSLVLDASVASSIIGRHCTDFDDATGAPLQWTRCTLDDVRRANVFQLVELEDLPYAVNVTVGGKTSPPGTEPGSVPGSVLWHGVELDDLSELITSVAPASGAQIIPLYASKNVKVWSLPPAYDAAATR